MRSQLVQKAPQLLLLCPAFRENPLMLSGHSEKEPGPVHSTSQPSPSPLRWFRVPSTIRGRHLTSEEVILTHTQKAIKDDRHPETQAGVVDRPADGVDSQRHNLLCDRERVLCPLGPRSPHQYTQGIWGDLYSPRDSRSPLTSLSPLWSPYSHCGHGCTSVAQGTRGGKSCIPTRPADQRAQTLGRQQLDF